MMVRQLRLWSGLIFAVFVVLHLSNLSLGLISYDAMESMRRWLDPVWSSLPGQVLLYGSLLTHVSLALWGLYIRQTLRMRRWEAVQIAMGVVIPLLLLGHVVGTRGLHQRFGLSPDYATVMTVLWGDPVLGGRQALALLVVWAHLVIGVHFWLRFRAAYRTWLPVLYPAAVLIPTLALAAYVRVGLELPGLAERPDWRADWLDRYAELSEVQIAALQSMTPIGYGIVAGLLALVLIARQLRRGFRARFGSHRLRLADGTRVSVPRGWTVLEALRAEGIPHASVCGGRGRCTTCRIRIDSGDEDLPTPNETESTALQRIGGPEGVRLACQLRPDANLTVTPLLPPTASFRSVRKPGGVEGRERQIAVLFADLRGSTALGERLLPFDVVFILNQFFAELSAALHATGGHYAQFTGDGLMAMYGLDSDLDTGRRQAIRGAVEMQRRLDSLNERMRRDVGHTLHMGVGIHSGEAIVGRMGPPDAPSLTALGDTVNIAARLESLCKTYDCPLVVSKVTAAGSGLDLADFPHHLAEVKGRDGVIEVIAVNDCRGLYGGEAGMAAATLVGD